MLIDAVTGRSPQSDCAYLHNNVVLIRACMLITLVLGYPLVPADASLNHTEHVYQDWEVAQQEFPQPCGPVQVMLLPA